VDDYCHAIKRMQDEVKAKMSPEQRQMMEQFMGQMAGKATKHKISVKDQGRGESMLGYPTRHYTVYVDGQPHEELWLTGDKGLLASAGDYKKLMKMTAKLSSCIASNIGGAGSVPVEESAAYQQLMEKGWELRSVTHMMGVKQTHQVKSIEKRDIPKSQFMPPAGYRKVGLETMMKSGFAQK
jgi:hypothetical protein